MLRIVVNHHHLTGARLPSRNLVVGSSRCRVVVSSLMSTTSTNKNGPIHKSLHPNATSQERQAFLHRANAEMFKYDEAKRLLRQGKLPSKNPSSSRQQQTSPGRAQLAVVGLFLVSFFATPFLGRKIAQDKDFRDNYVPSWLDYSVQTPENAWTREELHEQMLEAQKDLRERVIAGEFTEEKLRKLQRSLQGLDYLESKQKPKQQIPAAWDRLDTDDDDEDDEEEEDDEDD